MSGSAQMALPLSDRRTEDWSQADLAEVRSELDGYRLRILSLGPDTGRLHEALTVHAREIVVHGLEGRQRMHERYAARHERAAEHWRSHLRQPEIAARQDAVAAEHRRDAERFAGLAARVREHGLPPTSVARANPHARVGQP